MMELRYSQWAAHDSGVTLEPDEELKRLGISFRYGGAVDGTAKFYGCENVPDVLPPYIERTEPLITYVFGKTSDLIFDCLETPLDGVHPQQRMRGLGITWDSAIPQSVVDQWWFYGCQNVPNPLPKFLRVKRAGKEAK